MSCIHTLNASVTGLCTEASLLIERDRKSYSITPSSCFFSQIYHFFLISLPQGCPFQWPPIFHSYYPLECVLTASFLPPLFRLHECTKRQHISNCDWPRDHWLYLFGSAILDTTENVQIHLCKETHGHTIFALFTHGTYCFCFIYTKYLGWAKGEIISVRQVELGNCLKVFCVLWAD